MGKVGCFKSISVLIDDENERINSSFLLINGTDSTEVGTGIDNAEDEDDETFGDVLGECVPRTK